MKLGSANQATNRFIDDLKTITNRQEVNHLLGKYDIVGGTTGLSYKDPIGSGRESMPISKNKND